MIETTSNAESTQSSRSGRQRIAESPPAKRTGGGYSTTIPKRKKRGDRPPVGGIGRTYREPLRLVEEYFGQAGVDLNGSRPWDVQVVDPRMYRHVLGNGSLGLGESYMAGWWECRAIDQLIERLLRVDLDRKVKGSKRRLWGAVKAKIFNLQSRSHAYDIGRYHYDIGNDLYASMLDPRMIYSCGYWKAAEDLEAAQGAKLDLICRKLGLGPGMTMLDIGCGWGGLARFAAEQYGVEVRGITVSQAQAEWARDACRGLPVEIRLEDYRDVEGEFDRVVSVGMFEHVGYKNYGTFMRKARRCLGSGGLFLLHTIGSKQSFTRTDPWIDRYIFPNAVLPSARQITTATEGVFVLEDWHNFGADYDRTLMAWHRNFVANWEGIRDRYDERFYRMWRYYLLSCAGTFRARRNQLWQMVFSKTGVQGGYQSIR